MPSPTEKKIRALDPTTVAAQPGYRAAFISTDDDGPVTDETKPESLWVGYAPVIAWIIHPYVQETPFGTEVVNASTYAVTTDGIINDSRHYIVSPEGSWSWPDGPEIKSEDEARKHYIETRLASPLFD